GHHRRREAAGGGPAVTTARRTRSRRPERRRGRPAATDLHVLPPRPLGGGAGRAHAANARRAHDGGDRAGLPRARADHGPAARALEAQDPQRRYPLPRPARAPPPRADGRGPRRAVPAVQRGLRGDGGRRPRARRPVRGGHPARPHPDGADARRTRGARPAGADAPARRAPWRPRRRRRRSRPARGPGPHPVGPPDDRRGRHGARRRVAPEPARPVPGAGGDRGVPRHRRDRGRHRLVGDRRALRRARADESVPGRRAEPRGRGGDGGRTRRRARPRRRARRVGASRRLSPPARDAGRPAPPARPPGRGGRGLPRRARARRRRRRAALPHAPAAGDDRPGASGPVSDAAASAASRSSRSASSPLTPTPPTTAPSTTTGKPPRPRYQPPWCTKLLANAWRSANIDSIAEVGRPNVIAVHALLVASPALNRGAPSMRSNATRTPAVSTTATVTARPSLRAAAVTWSTSRRAPWSVTSGRAAARGGSASLTGATYPGRSDGAQDGDGPFRVRRRHEHVIVAGPGEHVRRDPRLGQGRREARGDAH